MNKQELTERKAETMQGTIKGASKGRYSKENQEWLEQNIGKTFECERHNFNYIIFKNGYLCHIYECFYQ